jgi:hypothetical protein
MEILKNGKTPRRFCAASFVINKKMSAMQRNDASLRVRQSAG